MLVGGRSRPIRQGAADPPRKLDSGFGKTRDLAVETRSFHVRASPLLATIKSYRFGLLSCAASGQWSVASGQWDVASSFEISQLATDHRPLPVAFFSLNCCKIHLPSARLQSTDSKLRYAVCAP